MSRAYIVGRGSSADIKIPKQHDAVGKAHVEIQQNGSSEARLTDLNSTNGTFVRASGKWQEVKGTRIVALDTELMLGDFQTTARKLLASAPSAAEPLPPPPAESKSKRYRSSKEEPPPVPVKKRTGPRRNEFGEIVNE